MNRLSSLALVGVALLSLAGCQSSQTGSGADLPASTTSTIEALLPVTRQMVDFEPAAGPDELAESADVVVHGLLVGATLGEGFGDEAAEAPALRMVNFELRVEDRLRGPASLGTEGGSVYFGVAHVPSDDESLSDKAAALNQKLTAQPLEVLAFLDRRTDGPIFPKVFFENAGRPEGAEFFEPFSQGLLVEDEDGGLVGLVVDYEDDENFGAGWQGFAGIDAIAEEVRS